MAGVRLVTDSSCDLPQDVVDAHGITVVPLTIRFGEEELTDRVELDSAEFYRRMANHEGLPETAAPSPGAFEEAFKAAGADGDAVVCLNISSALSATMASAQNAARALEGQVDVRVVDSKSITAGLGTQLVLAAEAAAGGASADEVVAVIEAAIPRTHILGGLDTLENLRKGGRIGGAKAMLGTMLSVKPVVDISTGVVEEAGKVRTRKKQMVFLIEQLKAAGDIERLVVCDGEAPDAEEFAD
ncbi:MAG TPA: DegV family protein, partial [Iamia sp.]|nr:DegV family protein [Iamia sp.]